MSVSDKPDQALLDRDAGWVNAEILPPEQRTLEREAARTQRAAIRFQAGYLTLLVIAPIAKLVPEVVGTGARIGDMVAAGALAAALATKLVLRARAPDAARTRARRDVEAAKAEGWRRCLARGSRPGDPELFRAVGAAGVATRWAFYRRCRIDDQISYYERRGRFHRHVARRWRVAQTVLTVLSVPAIAAPIVGWQTALVSLVAALLAVSEAWLQFRRSDFLSASFADTAAELRALRSRVPRDDGELARRVDETERLLERERWTWVALTSLTVLTAPWPRARGAGP